nr:MAG TPA: hypothetical protein [Caudoviricetes sp.]
MKDDFYIVMLFKIKKIQKSKSHRPSQMKVYFGN